MPFTACKPGRFCAESPDALCCSYCEIMGNQCLCIVHDLSFMGVMLPDGRKERVLWVGWGGVGLKRTATLSALGHSSLIRLFGHDGPQQCLFRTDQIPTKRIPHVLPVCIICEQNEQSLLWERKWKEESIDCTHWHSLRRSKSSRFQFQSQLLALIWNNESVASNSTRPGNFQGWHRLSTDHRLKLLHLAGYLDYS